MSNRTEAQRRAEQAYHIKRQAMHFQKVGARLTAAQKGRLEEVLTASGMTFQDWLRAKIDEEARRLETPS